MDAPSGLTEDQIDSLLKKALTDPEAKNRGLRAPDPGGLYWFEKDSGDGFHSFGDGVSYIGFRAAVRAVIASRGNLQGPDQRTIRAYWDILRNDPANWKSSTALTLAHLAPRGRIAFPCPAPQELCFLPQLKLGVSTKENR
ncbi:hypothetical protein ABT282_08005 [Streptomyces sp. NPDC000927]|uniref:hypothetical protein n=1 Tax=Streptomyces sp. NPDC000927 TaxID=3154371 RepID=UPI003322600D